MSYLHIPDDLISSVDDETRLPRVDEQVQQVDALFTNPYVNNDTAHRYGFVDPDNLEPAAGSLFKWVLAVLEAFSLRTSYPKDRVTAHDELEERLRTASRLLNDQMFTWATQTGVELKGHGLSRGGDTNKEQ